MYEDFENFKRRLLDEKLMRDADPVASTFLELPYTSKASRDQTLSLVIDRSDKFRMAIFVILQWEFYVFFETLSDLFRRLDSSGKGG